MREHLPRTYQAISRLASGGAEARGRETFAHSETGKISRGEPTDRNDGAGKTREETVADKKAALLEAARTNDPALLKELSESDDAESLQRAVAELSPGAADDAANARMAELMQDPSVASDLTKKYSMDGSRINDESGNEVFGATFESNLLFTLILPGNGSYQP